MSGRNGRKAASAACLSCAARQAINTNAARFSNSGLRVTHCFAFFQACGDRSQSVKHTVSQIPQLSKSRHHASISAGVTLAGSPTNEASMRASVHCVCHRATARSWSRPRDLAYCLMIATDRPKALSVGRP